MTVVASHRIKCCCLTAALFYITDETKIYLIYAKLDVQYYNSKKPVKNTYALSKSAKNMLISRESRSRTATLQLFQTSIVLIMVMVWASLFGGGNQVVERMG